jgi:serine/threonine-protein kinase HipA
MVFNVLACNRDDHSKNFGFILNSSNQWELSPAFDVTYAFNPEPGKWTATQQMSIRGKREALTTEDLLRFGRQCNIATLPKLRSIMDQVIEAIKHWENFAAKSKVRPSQAQNIQSAITAQIRTLDG